MYFIILIYLLIKYNFSQIILPLNFNESFNNFDFVYNFLNQEIYTEFNLGTPKQKINSYILFNDSGFYISNSFSYNHNKSSSFKSLNNFKEERYFTSNYFEWAINSTDTFYLLNKEKKFKKYKNFNFLYLINEQKKEKYNNKLCNSILGFKPAKNSFIDILKVNEIIDRKCVTFDLEKNIAIIGNYPYEIYNKIYNKNNFLISNLDIYNFNFNWQIKIDKIFGENKTIEYDKTCKFNLNVEGLIGTKKIQEFVNKTFFNDLIEQKKCFHKNNENKFGYYYCNNNINLNNFQTIFFNQKSFNFTFNFNHKDLFKKVENYYYFLIIFNEKIEFGHEITFGKIFFKKYLVTIEQERKIIGISLKNLNNNKINYKFLIVIILIIIIILLLFIFLKLIYFNKKKHHLNIIDDYEYSPKLIE